MSRHPFRIPAAPGRRSGPRLARSALAVLALGLAGTGASNAANLVPMFKHEAPRVTSRKPVPVPHLAAPRITIVGAIPALQHNCGGPRPLFLVKVILHNSGGPLAAKKGDATVYDNNPGTYHMKPLRLVSHGIALPAIAGNANGVVNVPVISLAPYAGEVGVKPLKVLVSSSATPNNGGFKSPPIYHFSVTVPKGFCARRAQ